MYGLSGENLSTTGRLSGTHSHGAQSIRGPTCKPPTRIRPRANLYTGLAKPT